MPPCIFPIILFFCVMTFSDFHHACFWCRSLKKFGINIMNNWINMAQAVGSLWSIVVGLCQISISEQQYSVLLLVCPSSEPSIVWTMTRRMWFFLISYSSTHLFLFLSFSSCFSPFFLIIYEFVCSYWKDNAKTHHSFRVFFIFSVLSFYLDQRMKQNW